ncbi:reverse transcriptase [Phytophthora cinnamomi]|uniref:reverse transcriptase n=1 Tax=Phytophthora cinnamomi TaxID=4785 RepID=UPI00355A9923|nr:reverse transcriptase [Phytophthora cinnamomi]
MIPAGIRLDLFYSTAKLPDEVIVPLLRSKNAAEMPRDILYITDGPAEPMSLPSRLPTEFKLRKQQPDGSTHDLWIRRTRDCVPTVIVNRSGKAVRVVLTNVRAVAVWCPAHFSVVAWAPHGVLPLEGYVRLSSAKYRVWQVLAYEAGIGKVLLNKEQQLYEGWLARQPPAVERRPYKEPEAVVARPPEEGGEPGLTCPQQWELLARRGEELVEFAGRTNPSNLSDANDGHVINSANSEWSPQDDSAESGGDESDVVDENSRLTLTHDQDMATCSTGQSGPSSPSGSAESRVQGQQSTHLSKSVELMPGETVPGPPSGRSNSEEVDVSDEFLDEDPEENLRLRYLLAARLGEEREAIEDRQSAESEHSAVDLALEDYAHELAFLPDLAEVVPTQLDYSASNVTCEAHSAEQSKRLVDVLKAHEHIMISSGNALRPPSYGVVCDIDVQGHEPIRQRARRVPLKHLGKLYELLKALLKSRLIAFSNSPWASPIVIVLKKNGVDIRLCIDYKMVNAVTLLMEYAMPLVDDLLTELESYLWFCSLDAASGFWAPKGGWSAFAERIRRAEAESEAQRKTHLVEFRPESSPMSKFEADRRAQVEPDPLEDFISNPDADMFSTGEPDESQVAPVFERRSFVDDICFGGRCFGDCLNTLNILLTRFAECRISVSFPKSTFVQPRVDFLSHGVTSEGIQADPKKVLAIAELPFPKTKKGMQAFLGALNYYARFIQNLEVYGAVLYQLKDADFEQGGDLSAAKTAFAELKKKVADAPIVRHFDSAEDVHVMLFANDWALSSTLMQMHDGKLHPVRFCGLVLKDNELGYHPAEKEVLALLQLIKLCHTLLAGKTINVYTRFSTLEWVFNSKSLYGRAVSFAVLLSPYHLKVKQVREQDVAFAQLLQASITPAVGVDELQAPPSKSSATVRMDPELLYARVPVAFKGNVLSFDCSAKTEKNGGYGSCSWILWRLPEWHIEIAASAHLQSTTMNIAEYTGMNNGVTAALERGSLI